MKIVLDVHTKPGADPILVADAILDFLCSSEDQNIDEMIESFDGADPLYDDGEGRSEPKEQS